MATSPGPQRLQDLFLEARALSGGELERFLEERCRGDAELLREMRSLLVADQETGLLDETLPGSLLAEAMEPPLPDRIGPYIVTGEIGRGGMATVLRAHDPRLRREVALKVIAGGPRSAEERERFVAEARAASRLDHPNICTIYDIGVLEDGRLYLAMPYYRHGTLADRVRAGPVGPGEAADVALQVGRALAAAHEAGIVHRDVKPANIAFDERGAARLLDFGVALLEDEGDPDGRSTAGTLAYMAPEQVRGDRVDRRADLWALGVVLFEMLAGRRPFTAPDVASLADAIVRSSPPDLRSLRPDVPPRLARIVDRALRRDPNERFQTAAEMEAALLAYRRPARLGAMRSRWRVALAAAVTVAALLPVAHWLADRSRHAGRGAAGEEAGTVVVAPFRVSADPALGYLREGMVDLLAARLTGEGGLRAVDPRTVHNGWRQIRADGPEGPSPEIAVRLADRLGARYVLLGEVVGNAATLVANASVLDHDGLVVGRGNAHGPLERLPDIVDDLAAQLLSTSAGEHPQRLSTLTSTSLPALRSFLEGQAAYRRGRYEEALLRYGHALEYDPDFALAGLGLTLSGGWVSGSVHARERGMQVAWQNRERLSARDRAFLTAIVGPDYPAASSVRDGLAAVQLALESSPDRTELWFELGDLHFHFGRVLERPDWPARAEQAFRRVLELDSTFAPASHHLVALHAAAGDVTALERAAEAYLAHTPTGATADYIRWRLATAGAQGAGTPPALAAMDPETLGWIAMSTQDEGVALADGRRAAELLGERSGTNAEELERLGGLAAFLLNAGQPAAALEALERLERLQPDPAFGSRWRILTALWGDGDAAAAEAAATELERTVAAEASGSLDRCVAAQWRLSVGGTAAPSAKPVPAQSPQPPAAASAADRPAQAVCAAVVAALVEGAPVTGPPGPAVRALAELVTDGPARSPLVDGHTDYGSVALARLLAESDPAGALAAVRRRQYFHGWQPYLAASLREEWRLAARIGDTEGALRAATHFVALRSGAEAVLRPDVEEARAFVASSTAAASAP